MTAEKLVAARQEVLAAHGRFVGHHLGNVLTGLSLSLELLQNSVVDAAQQRLLERCLHLCGRLGETKNLLMAMGGRTGVTCCYTQAAPLLQAALDGYVVGEQMRASCRVAPGAERLWGEPTMLREALLQLVRNSCDALPKGGSIRVAARPATKGSGVVVEVQDDGEGVPSARLASLGRTPYSTRSHGHGMGLMLVAMVVERLHGGRLAFSRRSPCGLRVRLYLPNPVATA